ncbi:MAG: hypothetical protein IAF94_18845 [Pirellulaceae bacterium]|nr:hypothetical protein [Pirellulaceae bacterium]
MIDLNEPTALNRLPGPMRANGEEGVGQKKRSNRLITAAKDEDRPAGRFALAVFGHDGG